MSTALERAEELYHDLGLAAVRAWRDAHDGAKAVGYLPVWVPRELVAAAGMLPVGIMGGGDRVEIVRGDAYYQSYICQLPRSVVELALSGRFDCLDGFLFPSTCDVIRNLTGIWQLHYPERLVRYVDLPQTLDVAVGLPWWRGELRTLWIDLCKLAGCTPDPAALSEAIGAYNANRRAVAELTRARAEAPAQLPAHEVHQVLRAGNLLDAGAHTALVYAYLDEARARVRPRRDLARVVVTGAFCEQPPLGLIQTLEMSGCAIVWDDMVLGSRWLTADVVVDGDPLTALADAYFRHTVQTATRYAPAGARAEQLLRIVHDTRAEGVVFAAPSFCDPALLEQPMLEAALDRAGVPWTAFKYAENLGQFQVIREQAGTFADSIKLWGDAP